MKITYKFLKDLKELLTDKNWQQNLDNRIAEIDNELSIKSKNLEKLAVDYLSKYKRYLNYEKGKDKTLDAEYEIDKKFKIDEIKYSWNKLKNEKIEIEKLKQEGKYKLGIAPFEKIEDASLLLANIQVLYSTEFEFNKGAVKAIESMLSDNFDSLYKDKVEVQNLINKNHQLISKKSPAIDKILSDQEISLYDVVPEEIFNKFSEAQQREIQDAVNGVSKIDKNIIKYCANIFKFADLFKYNYSVYQDELIFGLAASFDSLEAIDKYLLEEVSFSTITSIESRINGHELPNLPYLTDEELAVWHKLNNEHGQKAIKLFGQSADLKKHIDVVSLKNESNLLEIIQKASETIKFSREDESAEADKIAELAHKYNISEEIFDRILDDILPYKKQADNLPNIEFKIGPEDNKYTFNKLPAGDARGLFLGRMTRCCQSIGEDSEKCVIDGYTKADAGFYIITDKNGKVIAQSYAWIGKNDAEQEVLVLDSFEATSSKYKKNFFLSVIKKLLNSLQGTDFAELYLGSGGGTPWLKGDKFEIEAKDGSLYRYYDSKKLYKISENVELAEVFKETAGNLCNNFKEYIEYSPDTKWNKIYADNTDKISNLHGLIISGMKSKTIHITFSALQSGSITLDEIVSSYELITEEGRESCSTPFFTSRTMGSLEISLLDKVLHLKQKKLSMEELYDISNNICNISPQIIEKVPCEIIVKYLAEIDGRLDKQFTERGQSKSIIKDFSETVTIMQEEQEEVQIMAEIADEYVQGIVADLI